MNTSYDTWLSTQPDSGLIRIEPPIPGEANDYPVDEWDCCICAKPVGYCLSGDHGGGWVDCYLVEAVDEFICDDCLDELESQVP